MVLVTLILNGLGTPSSVNAVDAGLMPVTQTRIRRVGVPVSVHVRLDDQLAPVVSDRVGPIYTQLIEPFGPEAEGTGLVPTVQVTLAGRHFFDQGNDPTMTKRYKSKEGQDVWVRGRITSADLSQVLQTDVFAVIFLLFDESRDDSADPVHQEELVVDDFIGTALVVDATWKADAQGYSFSHRIQGDLLTEGGRTYRAEYTVKTKTKGMCGVDLEIDTIPRRTSRAYFGS